MLLFPSVTPGAFSRLLGCPPKGGRLKVRRDGRQRRQEDAALEDENRRLKHIVAEQVLDIAALKGVLGKKW
jgi:hypothetical protein